MADGTRELRYGGLGDRDPGDIWGTRRDGIIVVVSSRPANWRGEDRDVYAHVDTWYTVRTADEAETALWNAAVAAVAARRELRGRLGAGGSYRFNSASRQLVSDMTKLDSYDDRWEVPAAITLDAAGVVIEDTYVAALAALTGH